MILLDENATISENVHTVKFEEKIHEDQMLYDRGNGHYTSNNPHKFYLCDSINENDTN